MGQSIRFFDYCYAFFYKIYKTKIIDLIKINYYNIDIYSFDGRIRV